MKISLATVYNVLKDLKSFHETFASVAARYNISPTSVASIFDNHVNVPRRKLPETILIDEVYAFDSGNKGNYVCVLLDFETNSIIDILPSRKKQNLINYFTLIPREERLNVKIVSSDMWRAYRNVTKIVFPNAVCSCDKFHVIQELTRRVDRVRIETMNKFKVPSNIKMENLSKKEKYEIKIKRKKYNALKKFNWVLFKNDSKLFDPNVEKKYSRLLEGYYNPYDIREYLIECDQRLENALYLKDELIRFYNEAEIKNAYTKLSEVILEFESSDIESMRNFAKTLREWRKPIVNSFIKTKSKRKVSNGPIENINKTIKNIKHNSNGYRNWERFRNRILYVVNDDVTFYMYPRGK